MPELPEVETICRGLRARIKGAGIARVEVLEPRLRVPVSPDFAPALQGRTILDVERRGKYILIVLDGDRIWLCHLGMSGKLIYVEARRPREKHDHIIIGLDDHHELRYHDPRRFGLSLVAAKEEVDSLAQIKSLGLDPFDPGFDADYLYARARKSERRIRDLLLDQGVVAGVGNIYANEILFRAGIRPTRRAHRIGSSGARALARAMPRLLEEAVRWCGTSFSDYRDAEDRYGEFQKHLRVYDREGEDCRRCGSKIKRVALGNRSAFYCPRCQR